MVFMTYTIECTVHFLNEQQTKLYKRYCLGVAQLKNVLGVNSTFQAHTCSEQERYGV